MKINLYHHIGQVEFDSVDAAVEGLLDAQSTGYLFLINSETTAGCDAPQDAELVHVRRDQHGVVNVQRQAMPS